MARNGEWSFKKVQWTNGGFRKRVINYYKTIEKYKNKYTVLSLCKLFKITRASYYRWCCKGKPEYDLKIDMNLALKIKNIFTNNNGIYGSPRIRIILNNQGLEVSQTKVARIMKIFKLYSIIRVKKMYRKPKEIKTITHGPNYVNRNWSIFLKNECWVTDVSYIPLNKKFAYLSIIKDANTGFIVGHKLSLKNDVELYRKTLEKASFYRNDLSKKLIIHSDNVNQYTSIFAKKYAKRNNIIISLSRPGNSIDNAMCETFFSSLKEEWKQQLKQNNFLDLEKSIDNYIEFYNYERIMVKHKTPPAYVYLKLTQNKKNVSNYVETFL
ncbi:IS3 family transposase [Spiroplasma tabanidicola]|uniref:IS3 family transposase n=1 Tax=Spiroplasma tabanidicola TaxID=324079 RepID=A0A6I6C3Z4_9MOLU|nr:IS3 family transposase [Spiroplasma tabanidicola]QGS51537.1 IS3 family transposase [Spiroplasma tabanidicola]